MKRYISWTRDDIPNLAADWDRLVTEVDAEGFVWREVAIDRDGGVAYRSPSHRHGRTTFDNVRVETPAESDADDLAEAFEAWWQAPLQTRNERREGAAMLVAMKRSPVVRVVMALIALLLIVAGFYLWI